MASAQTPGQPEKKSKEYDWAMLMWHSYITGEEDDLGAQVRMARKVFSYIPSPPRCKVCNAPFRGVGGKVVSLLGFSSKLSRHNPNLCDRCEKVVRKYQVGIEAQMTLLFADVRGSTTMAEKMKASEYHSVINQFYKAATDVLVSTDALVDKLVGDEVIGLYVPGIAGPDYAKKAVQAGQELLRATGHGGVDGPWLSIGAGVHTGVAYIGAVGTHGGMSDITVLGDAVNTTARLASSAKAGEVLVSKETCQLIGADMGDCETRLLELKGRSEPVEVSVLNA